MKIRLNGYSFVNPTEELAQCRDQTTATAMLCQGAQDTVISEYHDVEQFSR
jgi:hypothetical protein